MPKSNTELCRISLRRMLASALNNDKPPSEETGWNVSDEIEVVPWDKGQPLARYQITVSGKIAGDCLCEISEADVQHFSSEQNNSAPAWTGLLAEKIRSALSRTAPEATARVTPSQESELESAESFVLVAKRADLPAIPFRLQITPALFKAVAELAQDESRRDNEPVANLDLILDVELNAMLRFGQRQMLLREILELKSGSVVELDRKVEEPVELLLDGTVLARGEAVIVDGNYGLRITEVLYPMGSQFIN